MLLAPLPDRTVALRRRLVRLYAGLVLYGLSMAMMVRADLGLDPWDVLHQGLSEAVGLSFGLVTIAIGAVVLLLWWPLRQRPGLGTVSNVVVIGLAAEAGLALLPELSAYPLRVPLLAAGIVLNGLAGACYIGAGLGPGPRDGLMTGLVRRTGGSVRLVRTSIEVSVLVVGWLLGGTVGVGTVLYAVGIGPILHLLLPRLALDPAERAEPVRPPGRRARRAWPAHRAPLAHRGGAGADPVTCEASAG